MLFKPKWFRILRYECRPAAGKIERLETVRKRYNIRHEVFALRIASSPFTTRRLQQLLLEEVKGRMLTVDEKGLWNAVLTYSLANLVRSGFASPAILGDVEKVIGAANSFDDVCDYIVSLGERRAGFPDALGIGQMIDSILEETRALS